MVDHRYVDEITPEMSSSSSGLSRTSNTGKLVWQGNQPNRCAQRFVEFCAGCHGPDGSGGDKAPSLIHSSNTLDGSDADLIRVVRDGTTGGMPPSAQIGDANIQAVIHYLRTLFRDRLRWPKILPNSRSLETRLPVARSFLARCDVLIQARA